MEYSAMAHEDAAELVWGKRVAVVGAGKSAMDTVTQCAEANGQSETIDTFCMDLHL
jgi:dimethylaniline monooxygenase (N-oxide forming)